MSAYALPVSFSRPLTHRRELQTRTRIGAQRKVNGDENATSKHTRQPSGTAASGASRATAILNGLKGGSQRPALGEVTTTAVNRKVSGRWLILRRLLSRDSLLSFRMPSRPLQKRI